MRIFKATILVLLLYFPLLSLGEECERKAIRFPSLETLIEACKRGHVDLVKQHIEAGLALNDYDPHYWTPLRTAIANRNYEIADLLIAHGADVNMKADYDETVLFMAVRAASMKSVRYLVAKGANVNSRNRDGETPLFMLKYYDRVAVADILINAGADVNARNKTGTSVLSHFVRRRDDDVVEFLVKHGAKE